jgi:hypothetical protein
MFDQAIIGGGANGDPNCSDDVVLRGLRGVQAGEHGLRGRRGRLFVIIFSATRPTSLFGDTQRQRDAR